MARAPAPAPLESPAVQRSKYLADLLSQTQQAPEIRSGAELGARLLAQGITQFSKNRADKAVAAETAEKNASQASALGMTLDRLSGVKPSEPSPLGAIVSPPVAPPVQQMPIPDPMAAPPAALAPQAAPMPTSAPMAAPQAAAPQAPPNPLGPTPGEAAYIRAAVQSGDPARVAEAQSMLSGIEQRMIAPPEFEITMVNGVPFRVDPQTGEKKALFENGLPQEAMVRDEFNPSGTRPGTFGQRGPDGKLTILETPPVGFEASESGLRPQAGGPSDPRSGQNQISNETGLRTEFDRATASYREAQSGYRKVQAAASEDSGIGDVAMIFGFMKTIDPDSTVREGEAATVQNTGSIPDRVVGLYNRALNGERLTPKQRQEIVSAADSQFQTYEQGYQSRVSDFVGMAEQYGLTPQNIVGESRAPRGERPAPRSTPRAAAPAGNNRNVLRQRFTPEQALAEARRRRGGQ